MVTLRTFYVHRVSGSTTMIKGANEPEEKTFTSQTFFFTEKEIVEYDNEFFFVFLTNFSFDVKKESKEKNYVLF